jgi:hypothetical protein
MILLANPLAAEAASPKRLTGITSTATMPGQGILQSNATSVGTCAPMQVKRKPDASARQRGVDEFPFIHTPDADRKLTN